MELCLSPDLLKASLGPTCSRSVVRPRARQNAATLCPLSSCSETRLRHFTCLIGWIIPEACRARCAQARWGSDIAHDIRVQKRPQCESYSARLLRALLPQLWEYHVRSFGRILSEKASTNSDVHAGLDVGRPMRQIKLYNPAELGPRKCSEWCPTQSSEIQGDLP